MKRLAVLFLQAGLLLTACGGGSNNQGSYSEYTPTSTSQSTSVWTPWTPSTQTTARTSSSKQTSDKEKVINYLKAYGTYSVDSYGIGVPSTFGSWSVYDTISYRESDDKFTTSVLMEYASAEGTIENFGMATFKWGSFTSGSFLGSTTYTLSRSRYMNAFSFVVEFGACPSFQVKSYRTLQTDYSSSVSEDASACADCVGRAINNLIKSIKSMGATSNLW